MFVLLEKLNKNYYNISCLPTEKKPSKKNQITQYLFCCYAHQDKKAS